MATYINNKEDGCVETIDEFYTWKDARDALNEYQLNWWAAGYYISSRSTKEWRESSQPKESK